MTQQTAPTKAEIVEKLRAGGEDALTRLRSIPAQAFEEGRYENGWNARQILAHIASIEWTYPRLLELARSGPAPRPAREEGTTPAAPSGPILSYNDRQVEKRADASVDALLDEFEKNRAATVAAIEATEESLFSVPVKSAGGVQGSLAEVLNYVAVMHVAQHVNDIAGASA
jgi:DinB superfamily